MIDFIRAGTCRIAYTRWGADHGQPVVLLHALTGCAVSWQPVAQRLSDRGFQVTAMDLRGHGDSDRCPDYRIEALADDVIALIEHLERGPVDLVGHSIGASVGWNVATAHPDLVRRLVLEDQYPDEDPHAIKAWRAWTVSWPWRFASRDAAIAYLREHDRSLEWWEPNLRLLPDGGCGWAFDRTAIVEMVRHLHARSEWDRLAQVRAPTLIIRGGRSTHVTPAVAARMVATIPDCRLVTIPDADHWVNRHADAFSAAVAEFLAAGTSAGPPRPAGPSGSPGASDASGSSRRS